MKTLFVTSEAAPFAKTGGLGDVLGSLPLALSEKHMDTRVIMPLYSAISDVWRDKMTFIGERHILLAWRRLYCGLFELKHAGVTWYFIDNEYYFKRGGLYGHFDDGERFAFFSRAVAEFAGDLQGWTPDVVHCNDWQTALVPVYMRELFPAQTADIKTVFTIHNIEYQGRFATNLLYDVFGLSMDLFNRGTMEYMGGLNLMKAAIEMSDAVTTVSPSYAEELRYAFYAHGLEGVIASNTHKIRGILNGLDTDLYDPSTDQNLFINYDSKDLSKKATNKAELQKLLGLTVRSDVPVVAMITRLVSHKGIDLLTASIDSMMDTDIQFVVLGNGEWRYENILRNAENAYKGRFCASIMYNPSLAMKIYAGADIFLMPSLSEPCGLAQMIAMRYGTLPLVRETGGLKDTVMPYNETDGSGSGFTFTNYNAHDMMFVLRKAANLYHADQAVWKSLVCRDMEKDFSWNASSEQYIALYKEIR